MNPTLFAILFLPVPTMLMLGFFCMIAQKDAR